MGIYLYERGCICLDSLVLRVRYWRGGGGGGAEFHRKKKRDVWMRLYIFPLLLRREATCISQSVSQSMNGSVRESVTALGVNVPPTHRSCGGSLNSYERMKELEAGGGGCTTHRSCGGSLNSYERMKE